MDDSPQPRFACDAMLGGLARWLRAAGYDASWREGIDDWDLIRLARDERRTLLTSDTGILKVGIVRDGEVPTLFIPHGLTTQRQLGHVLGELRLPLREPRCMACGGGLAALARERAAGRVPPRSLAGFERFWECDRCARVFWEGTHWRRIAVQLEEAARP